MHDDLPDVPALRAHEPPPGGLATLRERLDAYAAARRTRPRRRWWLVAAPALALAVAIAFLVVRRPSSAPPVDPPTKIVDKAIAPTFYWVASTPSTPHAAPPAIPTVAPAVSIADAPRVNFGVE
jgi:hypothetical protein